MVSVQSKTVWMKRQQCPCGDWKCFITYEGEIDENNLGSQSIKNDSGPTDTMVAPYVGMVFKSDDEAFEYYGNFARKKWIFIRKERSRKKQTGEHQRDRKSVRCGCDAKMYLSKEADQERILLLSKAGFPIHRIFKVLELEKGIQGGQLSFLERDVRNFIQRNRKKVVQENDALLTEKRESETVDLLEACRANKEADPYFVYDVTTGILSNHKMQPHDEVQYMHLKTCLPIEDHARSVLTPFAFNGIQQEMVLAMQYAASEMANGSYLVRHFKKVDGERLVIWIPEDEQIHCSCKEFESTGILCRHALRVLLFKNCFQLPSKYLLNRWRQESSLFCYSGQSNPKIKDDWYQDFNSLTETLFSEAMLTRQRSDFVHRELTKELRRLIGQVRDMPAVDEVVLNVTLSPTNVL
ncbi:UNVERIFIED_CONTAM: putative protein FAR1-RELATED SEQUENCE 10 [Sesamum angustifolium]|uniref:Protein FAR1-RELATED SEQUENCE n=1 Tax=Sesamum angustifolium TaxID=2727405 RepID=A0AAW2PB90_9LAMI